MYSFERYAFEFPTHRLLIAAYLYVDHRYLNMNIEKLGLKIKINLYILDRFTSVLAGGSDDDDDEGDDGDNNDPFFPFYSHFLSFSVSLFETVEFAALFYSPFDMFD